jgi:UDP-N-acetylmuramoyl-tripeptide--D-alanyl-D-alanine ligase
MEPRSLKFIAAACGGELSHGSQQTLVYRICTDSRQAQEGDLFFALPGERFDGHDFLLEAIKKGVTAIVAERGRLPANFRGCPVIRVGSTRQALVKLAAAHRKEFALPAVAVCGSNGKTMTKELIASVLREKLATLWSEASFNNDIGVPLSLLKLGKSHQAMVMEAGTNHPGELAPLIKLIEPKFGVVTTIGREHLEFFGELSEVAQEEGWLAELLPADGILFVDGDNEWTPKLIERTRAAVVRVGFSDANDWRVRGLRTDAKGTTFSVDTLKKEFAGEYRINLLGRHQVLNAVFALAIGVELGLERAEIERGLAACKPAKMRLELGEFNGVQVLDDAYNANADSTVAALQTMQSLPCKGRRVAVLGDMAELGSHSEAAHEEIGRRAAELGADQLFAVGKMAAVIGRGARAAGLTRIFEFADADAAGAALKSFSRAGDLVLLKASRAARFERISAWMRASCEWGSGPTYTPR